MYKTRSRGGMSHLMSPHPLHPIQICKSSLSLMCFNVFFIVSRSGVITLFFFSFFFFEKWNLWNHLFLTHTCRNKFLFQRLNKEQFSGTSWLNGPVCQLTRRLLVTKCDHTRTGQFRTHDRRFHAKSVLLF